MTTRAFAAVCCAALMAAGCVSGRTPSDHFYRLEAPAPAERAERQRLGLLQVDLPRTDGTTGSRALIYRSDSDSPEVGRHAYALWVDTPPRMIQQALTRYLGEAGIAEQVILPELRVDADHELKSTLHRLERIIYPSPTVVLELELAVTRRNDRTLVLKHSYREERPARGPEVSDSVLAYDAALGRILERFTADLIALP